MTKIFKRKYEKRLFSKIVKEDRNRGFLIEHLKKEWEVVERSIEKDRKKKELYHLTKQTGVVLGYTILGIIAVCGAITVAPIAPNILSAFGKTAKYRRYFKKQNFKQKIDYFKRHGYLELNKDRKENIIKIKLTDLGERQLAKYTLANLKVIPQERWDGVWRIVIFDIPEKYKWARDSLRFYLKRMGFYQLQKSAFASPHPCREEVGFLGKIYGLDEEIRLIETNNISYDDDLKKYFFR